MRNISLKLNKEFYHIFDGITDPSSRYTDLARYREQYLELAYVCSMFTIPEIIPRYGGTDYQQNEYDQDINTRTIRDNVGYEGVVNLSTKFYQNLFPANTNFFNISADDVLLNFKSDSVARAAVYKEYNNDPNNRQALDPDFAVDSLSPKLQDLYKKTYSSYKNEEIAAADRVVDNAMREYHSLKIDHKMKELFQNLLVAGNALLEITETNCKVYALDRYVVNRDPEGELTEIIVKERVDATFLPKEFVEKHKDSELPENTLKADAPVRNDVDVYTWTKFVPNENAAYTFQSAFGHLIPGSESIYPKDACRFIPCRYSSQHNRDYGIPFVKQCLYDLYLLDTLKEASAKGWIEASRIIYQIDHGTMTLERFARIRNGGGFIGPRDSINVVQASKVPEFSAIASYMNDVENKLQRMFAMHQAAQRAGERVTAEEIRVLVQALQSISSGFYSLFAYEVQMLMIARIFHIMRKKGTLPAKYIPGTKAAKEFDIKPTTGLAAVGKHEDILKLVEFIGFATSIIPVEALSRYVNIPETLNRAATGYSVNHDNLIKSPEEIAEEDKRIAEQQQAEQQRMMETEQENKVLTSGAATQFTKGAVESGLLDPAITASAQAMSNQTQ